jgi:hypothetical protein
VPYARLAIVIVSSPWRWQEAPDVGWQRQVQLNHAFGGARSQSLECDGWAHTFVWGFDHAHGIWRSLALILLERRNGPSASTLDIAVAAETPSQHKTCYSTSVSVARNCGKPPLFRRGRVGVELSASPKACRAHARGLSKRGRECAGFGEPQRHSDRGDRSHGASQQ